MPQTTRAQCPGCSASLADDGYSDVLTCAYCGTRVTVHRPHTPPRAAVPRTNPELDALHARLSEEERAWQVRIRAAERVGSADVALPLLGLGFMALVVFITASIADDPKVDQAWEPLAGCAFWVLGPLVAISIHRLMARRREKRARVVAGHRDEALAPLRARIAEMERPAPPTERQRRIQMLQYERDETRRRLDRAYLAPEEVRTSGKADIIRIPLAGCGAFLLFFAAVMAVMTNMPDQQVSDTMAVLFFLGPFVFLILAIVVPLVWRSMSRRARVRTLEEERDRDAPKLQQRLHGIESELARLS